MIGEGEMNIWNLLFPEKCVMCGQVLRQKETGVCKYCAGWLPVVTEPRCMHCGKPLASERRELCYDCAARENKSFLREGAALWEYTDPMRRVIANFKYGGCERDAAFFAGELVRVHGDRIRRWDPDVILPVPLHWRKRWFRGYNQAESIAAELGRQMDIRAAADVLVRRRYTAPQKDLDHGRRFSNLRDAIAVRDTLVHQRPEYHTVLLVDDIYTTGATLEACAAALSEWGVQQIYFLCLCVGRDCQ